MDDKDKLSRIPVSDLTRENLEAIKKGGATEKANEKTPHQKKSNTPLIIATIVLVIGVAVALFFVLRKESKPAEPADQDTAASEDIEVIWEPSAGSEDPGGEYIAEHQGKIDNPDATPTEKFEAQLDIINYYIAVDNDYGKAEALLDAIDRTTLTNRNLYSLYGAYTYLYSLSGDTASYEKYERLAEEILNQSWDEEASETNEKDD